MLKFAFVIAADGIYIKFWNHVSCRIGLLSIFDDRKADKRPSLTDPVCIKFVYSKHPILGLTQEFCWVGAVGGRMRRG